MKHLLLFICFLITCSCSTPKYSLLSVKKPDLIKRMANLLTLDKKCRHCGLITDNGRVERKDDGIFYIYPDSVGIANITIVKKSGKEAGRMAFRVRDIDFYVCIDDCKKEIDDVTRFSKTAKMWLGSDDMECLSFNWESEYDVVIVEADKKTVIHAKSQQGSIDRTIKERFAALETGNLVLFRNIRITVGDITFEVADVVLEVK